ncbi:unnamed protein product, partial [Schistosoma mattheei]
MRSHAGCIEKVDDECDFGPLRDIMLPSFCVSLPRINIPIQHVIGVTKRPRGRAISADWSSSGESKEDSWQDTRSPRETIDRASSDDENPLVDILYYNFTILFFNPLLEYVCVFDGVGALKRRSCRSFSFSKSMSTYSAVKRFLKTFHLAGTPDYYNVYEVNEHDGTENKLNYHVNLRSQLRFDLKQPSILIRSKEPEESTITIKVYAGDLRLLLAPHVPPYEEVTINSETTASKVVAMALNNFGCGVLTCQAGRLENDVGAFNVRTLCRIGQQAFSCRTLESRAIDVCCVSGTRIQDPSNGFHLTSRCQNKEPTRFTLRVSGSPDSASRGLSGEGIALSSRSELALLDWIPVDSRLCAVRLNGT